MIIFLRSYYIEKDPRLQRYLKALSLSGLQEHCVAWDRLAREKDTSHITYFKSKAPVGAGLSNVWNLIKWNIFCLRKLFSLKQEISVVHAVDLDTGFAAALFAIATQKPLIYDAFDLYSASRATSSLMTIFLNVCERWVIKRATYVILPDECRYEQHGIKKSDRIKVIENIPASNKKEYYPLPKKKPPILRLVYAGALAEKHRGIEDLLQWAKNNEKNIILEIAGAGVLQDFCRNMAILHKNIIFHGNVSNEIALALMEKSDIILGFYYLSSPNHRYAAPNKYFEHLLLGRPLLTTTGTPPGERVSAHNSGWAINEGLPAIEKWWKDFSWSDAHTKGLNARTLWDRDYKNYFNEILLKEYIDLVKIK